MALKYLRKIIKISAYDSPNVRLAQAQLAAGLKPDNRMIVPGVLTWAELQDRLRTWAADRITRGIDAEFYEGPSTLLYPEEWIQLSNSLWEVLSKNRRATAMGIDPGEGTANTSWAIGDAYGLIELIAYKTPNTRDIVRDTIKYGKKHNIPSSSWIFDRGSGKQHVDTLREMGMAVRSVGFGEGVLLEPKRGMTKIEDKIEIREEHYKFLNRRAQMYGELSEAMDANADRVVDGKTITGFALPPASFGRQYEELLRQMALIPKWHDAEDRLFLPPKNRRPDVKDSMGKMTLNDLLGASPDELDSLVLMWHGIMHKKRPVMAGGVR